MRRLTVPDFGLKKSSGSKISMITCYDYWSAQIINKSTIDCLLVGDSASMVMHGKDSTVEATVAMMISHIMAVHKGAPDKFIVGDLPFMSYRSDLKINVSNIVKVMQAGAHAVKLEGATGNLELIEHIVNSGIPVMGHLGLTPQFVNQFGGFKVQAKEKEAAEHLKKQALELQERGCFALVLECIPSSLGKAVSDSLQIPTIGIGAGPDTDGQVLVMQDLLGMSEGHKPKFVKHYLNGHELLLKAFNSFDTETKTNLYPSISESYEV